MASFHYVGKTKPESYMYVYTSVCSEQFFQWTCNLASSVKEFRAQWKRAKASGGA